jgi:hypothetical protein
VPDDNYLDGHLAVTGTDIRPDVQVLGYPSTEVYWFRPLRQIPDFIESARRFFGPLP